MKNNNLGKAALCMLFTCLVIIAHSQTFQMVKDINNSTDGNPSNYNTTKGTAGYAVLNGRAYFSAYKGTAGNYGLWVSDTSLSSITLLKSFPNTISNIEAANGKLYFYTYNPNTYRYDVYSSDGTIAGTKAILTGLKYINNASFTAMGASVYFEALGRQLWKTDGTAGGTKLVADFGTEKYKFSGGVIQLTPLDTTLFFVVASNYAFGEELWKTNGTPGGTKLVKNIRPGSRGSMPDNLTVCFGKLYFTADDGTGIKLWASDGINTNMVANTYNITVNTGYYGSYQLDDSTYYTYGYNEQPFAVRGNTMYFQGVRAGYGAELVKYNITDSLTGPIMVADINDGNDGSYPENITAFGNTVYFSCTSFTGDNYLYKTNGSKAGTVLVKDINPGTKTYFSNFINAGGQLMFSYYNDTYGYEIWKSDGTADGTNIIKDIFEGAYSSYADNLTFLKDGIVLFSANNGLNGNELWKTDGTEAGTVLMKDINTTTSGSSNALEQSNTVVLNNKMYFTAYTPKYGYEPYVSDGTAAGTKLLADIVPGSNSSKCDFFTVCNNDVYFEENFEGNGHSILFKTSGATGKTSVVINLPGTKGYLSKVISAGNLVYFFYYDYDIARNVDLELWRTDGTPAGTYIIKTLSGYYAPEPVAAGNALFFNGYDDSHGLELWKTDGTTQSTQLVKDINPGSAPSFPEYAVENNGKLYFAAQNSNGRYTLYVSDGTAAGTKQLNKTVEVSGNIVPGKGKLFFPGTTTTNGTELWYNNGDTTTMLVKDIWPGKNSSNPQEITAVDSIIYFFAEEKDHGTELWKTNGTEAGTSLVKDISPNTINGLPAHTYFYDFTSASGRLYFMAETVDDLGDYKDSLYVSNGTVAGTHAVQDAGLAGVTEFNTYFPFVVLNYKIYFSAFSPAKGWELYGGIVHGGDIMPALTGMQAAKKDNGSFNAAIYPNPVKDVANIIITGNQVAADVTITDINGHILQVKNNIQPGILKLNIAGYSAGIYIVQVSAGKSNRFIKLFKQ